MEVLDDSGKCEAEENNDHTKGKPRVQRCRHGHGILPPPIESPPWYDVVEDETDQRPPGEVKASLMHFS